MELPTKMEVGWHNDLLEVKYHSSVEESHSALLTQVGDIVPSFVALIEEVSQAMLKATYKKTILGRTYCLIT